MTKVNRVTLILLLLISIAPAYSVEKSIEFHFWTSKATKNDNRVIRIDEHPCGEVAAARILKMPRYSKKSGLIPERVFELNRSGRTIRQWSMPVDGTVVAVRDNILFVNLADKIYQIGLDGRIGQVENFSVQSEPVQLVCAANNPFIPSEYVSCLGFKDLINGKTRILSYEMVCT